MRKNKGALLTVFEKGIKIWVKSKCNQIQDLELDISGSDLSFLKGKISNINIRGKEINFMDLPIKNVELTSSEINIELKGLYKINFKEGFKVFGSIEFNGKLLKEALTSGRWNYLGEWFSKELLGMNHLIDLKINNQELEIHATDETQTNIRKALFSISQKSGKILLTNQANKKENLLPSDQSINIDDTFLKNGNLTINGYAIVTP